MKGSANKPKAFGSKSRKDRDEDLLLFREMFRREKERNVVSLLDPVSGEFESAQGSFPLYKLPSGKKLSGNDSFGGDKEKNDYDWLKTPPATPLFPSLEMEASDPNMIFQRELPILHNIKPSRFSANKDEEPKHGQIPISPSTKSTTSSRSDTSTRSHATPSARPTSSLGFATTLKSVMNNNLAERRNSSTIRSTTLASTTKENPRNNSTSRRQNSDSRPTSRRCVSPNVRPRLPAVSLIQGFSDETPTNLITSTEKSHGRAVSANRVRPSSSTILAAKVEQKGVDTGRLKRQSFSPSVTRGRKVDGEVTTINLVGKSKNIVTNISSGNGTLLKGSKMVDRLMNARRLAGGEEKGLLQAKHRNLSNERPAVGRLMSKTSLDMAIKKMEINKNPVGLKSTGGGSNTGPSSRSTQGSAVRNSRIPTNNQESKLKNAEIRTRN